ncbi:MAG: hypothetical protein OSJ60_04150 [Lachnospiraceae bacterium]|jgi:hypothetical protein|nr:hypothetical protein C819_00017 [Lachnospiraceae bacterium 10-1]MCX4350809.1 hypothetical protein [Lachnospiraceae bacterium]
MPESTETNKKQWKLIILLCLLIVLVIVITAIGIAHLSAPKGYTDYTVQKEQYYVEYSEKYDYWDVLTVEYPRLEGISEERESQINQLMYDAAMDRVNYWHLTPSEEVKEFQKEYFSIFASDVNCDVAYHSQYLLSVDYQEYYSAGHPIYMTNGTERALTVNLITGECYYLADIIELNEDFVRLWDQIYSEETGSDYADDETIDYLLDWFLQRDEEINEDYFCTPFFYVTENKEFVIGISLDPKLYEAYTYKPATRSFSTLLTKEELEAFKKQSSFWELLEQSEMAGEVLPCEDKAENIWLGEDAGVWDFEF